MLLLGWGHLAWAQVPPKSPTKSTAVLRVSADRMRQLEIAKVGLCAFRQLKPAIGQIAFNEDASTVVLTPFSGRVIKLLAKVGDEVKRGDPLFEIDSPEVVQAQTELIAAAQSLEKSKSQLDLAQRVLERQTGLFAAKATSQRELDQARADQAAAETDLRTVEGILAGARNRLRVLMGRSEAAVARVERERAIDPSITINAPIDGTVIARKVGPGQYVRSDSGDPLYSIADLTTMWLKANVPESDVALVRVGQEIEASVAAVPGQVFKARVITIAAASDPATRRVLVRSEIPNPDGALKAEMFATFRIATGEGEVAPGVASAAIIGEGEATSVWVVREPMLFERRNVRLGVRQNGCVQIRGGLKLGEPVVVRGAVFLDKSPD